MESKKMPELNGQIGELHITLQVTRKDTGIIETVELIGTIADSQTETEGVENGSDTQHSGT